MERSYYVNIRKLALLVLPTFLRRPLIVSITHSVVTPLNELQVAFSQFREQMNYRMTHNGQVCYLRGALNDMFDMGPRRITITEIDKEVDDTIIYTRDQDRAQRAKLRQRGEPLVVNRRGFSGANKYDFIVNLPVTMKGTMDEPRLRAIIDTYKLSSKRYLINYI